MINISVERILDAMTDGITVQDLDFNVIYQNRMMRTAFGNQVGRKCYVAYEKRDRTCEECGVAKAFRTREPNVVLRTGVLVSGKLSSFENACIPLFDEKGTLIAGMEICRDVTSRVSLEEEVRVRNIQLGQMNDQLQRLTAELQEALEQRKALTRNLELEIDRRAFAEKLISESEARYRRTISITGTGYVVIDANGCVLDANDVYVRMTPYENLEQIRGRLVLEWTAPESIEGNAAAVAQTVQDGSITDFETVYLRRDGSRLHISVNAMVEQSPQGSCIVALCRDITERRKAEEARAQAQAERDAVETQLRQAQKLEAVGQLAAGIAHEINTPIQYVGDNIRFLKDSSESVASILRAYDELLRAVKNNRVTPELVKRVEEDLVASDLAYLLEQIPAAITETLEGVKRVAKIVQAMKEFSHPSGEKKELTNLNRAIETTATIAGSEWKHVADLELQLDPDLPTVPCFVGEFNQSLLNLVINAAHAIGDVVERTPGTKGKITMRTRHVGDFVEVRVEDTGTGIPETVRHRVFEPFFTTKEVGKGTGQGLSIVYNTIVKKHGGTVDLETKIGEGTTFILRLPIHPETASPESGSELREERV